MADRCLRAVGDDELLGGRAVLAECALHGKLDALACERLAVEGEHAVRPVGALQQIQTGGHPGLDRATGAADTRELVLGLHAPALVEERLVRGQLDAVRAEVVGDPEWEARGVMAPSSPSRRQAARWSSSSCA